MRSRLLIRFVLPMIAAVAMCSFANRDRLRGWLQPDLVVSGSMAPALLGPHYRQACEQCKFSMVSGADLTDVNQDFVCQNCGRRQAWRPGISPKPGTRTWIDTRAPHRRWQVYAYRNANDDLEIKRLVGLPGERITFAEGDVLANGKRLQKNVRQLRQVAIVVHESGGGTEGFGSGAMTTPTNLHRWHSGPSDDQRIGWSPIPRGWAYRGDRDEAESTALTYHHFLSYESPWPRDTPAAIQDDHGYNANLSRRLHAVDDVGIECDLELAPSARLECVLATRAGDVFVEVVRRGPLGSRISIRHENESRSWRIYSEHGPKRLLLGICDRRVLWAYGGDSGAMSVNWTPHRKWLSEPLRLRARGRSAVLMNLRIWRDVYYYRPAHVSPSQRLSAAHWLFLGDNVPVSIDGRFVPEGILGRRILGQVNVWSEP